MDKYNGTVIIETTAGTAAPTRLYSVCRATVMRVLWSDIGQGNRRTSIVSFRLGQKSNLALSTDDVTAVPTHPNGIIKGRAEAGGDRDGPSR
jgi:hypothetical protein